MQDIYQKLYTETRYGDARRGKCQDVKLLPHYEGSLIPPVLVVGCGRGEIVWQLRAKGIRIDGVDWVDLKNHMKVADITEPHDWSDYYTTTCMDVVEHIPEDKLQQLFKNLSTTKRQIISVHTGPSQWRPDGQELHVTQHALPWWVDAISKELRIQKVEKLDNKGLRGMFFCGE